MWKKLIVAALLLAASACKSTAAPRPELLAKPGWGSVPSVTSSLAPSGAVPASAKAVSATEVPPGKPGWGRSN